MFLLFRIFKVGSANFCGSFEEFSEEAALFIVMMKNFWARVAIPLECSLAALSDVKYGLSTR